MPIKYTVVYVIPEDICLLLEEKCRRATGKDLPTHNLHISFTFSFFLKEGYGEAWLLRQVKENAFEPISAWLTSFETFSQLNKKILYVRVEPFEELVNLQKQIIGSIQAGVEVDLTVYSDRVVPEFVPHISLDYEFAGDETILNRLRAEKAHAWFEVDTLTVIRMEGEKWEEVG